MLQRPLRLVGMAQGIIGTVRIAVLRRVSCDVSMDVGVCLVDVDDLPVDLVDARIEVVHIDAPSDASIVAWEGDGCVRGDVDLQTVVLADVLTEVVLTDVWHGVSINVAVVDGFALDVVDP
ncbi:MAG: hypothetical protein CL920_32310 [Deltaproteobacteria bacterium]|nr:hypothetical protein [Deltaproteobacteria bacterium]MBU53403.1 hypothetical protein [Deltaproteobacteria bacterium]